MAMEAPSDWLLSTLNFQISGLSDRKAKEEDLGPWTITNKFLPQGLVVESISPPYGPYVHKH